MKKENRDKFARQGLFLLDFPYNLEKATYIWPDKEGKAARACFIIGGQSVFVRCNAESIPSHLMRPDAVIVI